MNDKRIRVAVFDSNSNIRKTISDVLSYNDALIISGMFKNVNRYHHDISASQPDVIVMDIDMQKPAGIETLERISAEFPHIPILAQTESVKDDMIFGAINAGVSGIILKRQIHHGLTDAILEIMSGGTPVSPVITQRIFSMLRNKCHEIAVSNNYSLTAREKEVLSCIVSGMSYKAAACQLNISYETVKSHIKKIFSKIHVSSSTEAVAKAINYKIV